MAEEKATSLQGFSQQLSEATSEVASAGQVMSEAFNRTFNGIERNILRATKSGSLSVKDMVDTIISDLARIAVKDFIVEPLQGLFSSLLGSLTGRAIGGPVAPQTPYLVGERGPELFVPSTSGEIRTPASGARPQLVMNVQTQDAQSFLKSESQIAAMMSRLIARGQKNL